MTPAEIIYHLHDGFDLLRKLIENDGTGIVGKHVPLPLFCNPYHPV